MTQQKGEVGKQLLEQSPAHKQLFAPSPPGCPGNVLENSCGFLTVLVGGAEVTSAEVASAEVTFCSLELSWKSTWGKEVLNLACNAVSVTAPNPLALGSFQVMFYFNLEFETCPLSDGLKLRNKTCDPSSCFPCALKYHYCK